MNPSTRAASHTVSVAGSLAVVALNAAAQAVPAVAAPSGATASSATPSSAQSSATAASASAASASSAVIAPPSASAIAVASAAPSPSPSAPSAAASSAAGRVAHDLHLEAPSRCGGPAAVERALAERWSVESWLARAKLRRFSVTISESGTRARPALVGVLEASSADGDVFRRTHRGTDCAAVVSALAISAERAVSELAPSEQPNAAGPVVASPAPPSAPLGAVVHRNVTLGAAIGAFGGYSDSPATPGVALLIRSHESPNRRALVWGGSVVGAVGKGRTGSSLYWLGVGVFACLGAPQSGPWLDVCAAAEGGLLVADQAERQPVLPWLGVGPTARLGITRGGFRPFVELDVRLRAVRPELLVGSHTDLPALNSSVGASVGGLFSVF